jgi:hypothetical protein
MTLKASLQTTPTYTAVVTNTGGRLQTHAPITLRNEQILATVENITDIGDVVAVNVINNSTLVYNSTTQRYEIKQMGVDGGLF